MYPVLFHSGWSLPRLRRGPATQHIPPLRNLQSLVEIGVDKNTTVVFPAPLMSTIEELVAFLTTRTTPPAAGKIPA